MKQTTILTTVSLLSILLMTLHLTGDVLYKMAPAGFPMLFAVFVLVIVLWGTLVLAGRRSGYIIVFLGSLIELLMPLLHMKGPRGMMGGEVGNSTGAFFFVWILLALGVTSTFTLILSAHALLSSPWRQTRGASTAA